MKDNSLILIIGIVVCLMAFSCADTEENKDVFLECGSINALNDLEWLKREFNEKVKDYPESGILLFKYESKEVIEIQSSVMSSTNNSQYFCDGTKLNLLGPDDYQRFLENRIKIKILYGVDLWKLQ